MSQPIITQRVESIAIFFAVLGWYLLSDFNFLWFIVLFFTIDISAIGYVWGPKVGATVYNTAHNYFLPLVLLGLTFSMHSLNLIAFSLIWAAHIALDRALGYGLKLETGFQDTHLGKIGKGK